MISLLASGGYESWGRAAIDSLFTVVSYMTTTGFAICDNSAWPWLACIVLLFVSFHCGCSGSTTGGIKVDRLVVSYKAMANELKHRVHPLSVSQVRIDGHLVPDESVKSVLLYIVIYILVILSSIVAVALCGVDGTEAVSGVIASVGSVGPGLGAVSALENYSLQPSMVKFIYSFDMFLGRVEIYPVLIVLYYFFNRRK
jgi:trk system potassium uptake protein TrkH